MVLKKCPKCKSTNIKKGLLQGPAPGPFNAIYFKLGEPGLLSSIQNYRKIGNIDVYVCGKCGYTEQYVRKNDLQNLEDEQPQKPSVNKKGSKKK